MIFKVRPRGTVTPPADDQMTLNPDAITCTTNHLNRTEEDR